MTRGNLVDQFKKPPVPAAPTSATSSSSSSVSVHVKPTVGQWFQKNWGKAAAIFIVVIVSTIFIVRTVLIAKNKKKTRATAAGSPALNQSVEWESFLSAEPQLPRQMAPQPLPRVMPPHMMHAPVMQPGTAALPQQRAPPPQHPHVPSQVVERGLHQQRLPPADGVSGGAGLIPTMMPQSSRPQNVTFTIDSAPPVVAAPEKDEPKKVEGEEAQLMPPDVDSPSTGTEFNR